MTDRIKILVVIPTFNCANQIARVLQKISSLNIDCIDEINIIDNLSIDNTLSTAAKVIKDLNLKKIKLFQTSQNNNLGGTHKIAFDKAIDEKYDYVAIFHGDDQADFSDLLNLCTSIARSSDKKSYLGSRFSRKSQLIGYSKIRTVGNIGLNLIYSIKNLKLLTDLGSGLNIFFVDSIRQIDYHSFEDSLSFNYELLLSLLKSKEKIAYFPIKWSETDQNSNLGNMVIHAVNAIKILFCGTKNKGRSINSSKTYDIIEKYN
jgi:glycosyltransferase involved in cell wall biosynthesis